MQVVMLQGQQGANKTSQFHGVYVQIETENHSQPCRVARYGTRSVLN